MNEFSKFVGMDVHKATIAVSVAEAGGGEPRYVGEIANTPDAVTKLVRQLSKGEAPRAGGSGVDLSPSRPENRSLTAAGGAHR